DCGTWRRMRMWRRCSTARTASGCCGRRRVITRPLRLAMLLQRKPSEFSVLSPANGTQVQADTVDIALDVPPGRRRRGLRPHRQWTPRRLARKRNGQARRASPCRCQAGVNDIEIKGYNAIGQTVDKVTILRPGVRVSEKRGRLYVVAIGVDDYPNFKQNLKF